MLNHSTKTAFKFIRPDLAELLAYSSHGEDVTMPSEVDKLDTNESPYDLPEAEKEQLARQYQTIIESNRYPDGSHEELKSAIAQYVNENSSFPFDPSYISVGNGSDELIRSLLIATCVGTNASILVSEPTFSMYKILAQTLGITAISIPREETHFTIKRGQADHAIAQAGAIGQGVKVIFVVHPNSPTGNLLSAAEIEWLKSLPEDILVVIDEAYFEFSAQTLVSELPEHPNWAILRTFSKAFRLAAHRVGYCIAHPQLTQALEKIRLPYNLPSFSQAAALVALQNREQLLSTLAETQQERDKLYHFLSADSRLQVWESDANFIYLRLNLASREEQHQQQQQLVKTLHQQGTLVRHTANGIRISIGTPSENERTQSHLAAYLDKNF
ncbi:histidinol phosphate aminotransferase apoenzyme [Halothece sp. PCC 7418]|uniref:histidinol-phosphate transaminase n=1 Tax=Halothece sp. (strain PCC 7418) TaxID=65093 RepID=UPI0002A06BB1|nr:histidinol-phosphate transaminase [Halothece sp. PCC 7418]AFZ44578.1 histidinol phosphate aminotransferase apoenzyme [Halothece sp. PCC 7418]